MLNGYAADYEIMPTKKDTIGELRKFAATAEMVYLATDPDREGEAIAWHLQEALGLPDERVRRVRFFEITDKAVHEAFNHVGPIDMDMVNAQQARASWTGSSATSSPHSCGRRWRGTCRRGGCSRWRPA